MLEERFQAFFAHSFDAALITTPDGGILEANPAACAMFGYDVDELRALGRAGVVDTSDPRLAQLLHDRSATGRARGRLTMRRKDGSRFEADLSSSVYPDHDGTLRTSMLVRDLTEQIEGEQAARRESAELAHGVETLSVRTSLAPDAASVYRALLEFAVTISPAEALLVTEHDRTGARFVDAYAGWSAGGALGEELPPRDPPRGHPPERFADVMTEGSSVVIDDLRHTPVDHPRPPNPAAVGERSRSAMRLPMTVLGAVVGIAEFRSSRPGAFDHRHAAPLRLAATIAAVAIEDLRRSERERAAYRKADAAWSHLREVIHQAPVMMATAEGPNHVFTGANRRFLDTLGLRDIVGKSVREVFPEIEAQGIIGILDEVYRTGEPFVAEGLTMDLQVNDDLRRFYFNLVYQPIHDGDGNVTGIL